MANSYRSVLLSLYLLFSVTATFAQQIHSPVKWAFTADSVSETEATLYLTASLEHGWHIYSQFVGPDGPMPTTFTFYPADDYILIEKVKEESTPIKSYDQTFMMDIVSFERVAVFSQRIKLHKTTAQIKGKVEFMVCREDLCLPPDDVAFSIEARTKKRVNKTEHIIEEKATKKSKSEGTDSGSAERIKPQARMDQLNDTTVLAGSAAKSKNDVAKSVPTNAAVPARKKSEVLTGTLWTIFIGGVLAGLLAFCMPCIFPMVPFTIGYFMKGSTSRRRSIGYALLYGMSIIIIFVALGLSVSIVFGSDAMNNFSTSGIFNFFCFSLLIIFAASFLGAFNITLPSSWISKADAGADRKGFTGIFFLAATLVLVSFSCTGPLVGTILVETTGMGSLLAPVVGMFGFALALALPFTLFAIFPSWFKMLPKSGSWLNTLKVTIGFLELALALKFLSNIDLAYHWQWFDREVFLVLWIIIFACLGFYLLGKISLTNDPPVQSISPIRLFLSIITLAFTLYMIPGLWGAPLEVIAGFLPPQQTQDFDLYSAALTPPNDHNDKKYHDLFKSPGNINTFFDYEEGMKYARETGKPLLVDFTGHACVNCRKMETSVWTDPAVMKVLREDYVVVQLYVDDKTDLPEEEQTVSASSGRRITTIGKKWSDFQATTFKTNSQPYYVLLDHAGNTLVTPKGADYNISNFKMFLDNGLEAFNSAYKN